MVSGISFARQLAGYLVFIPELYTIAAAQYQHKMNKRVYIKSFLRLSLPKLVRGAGCRKPRRFSQGSKPQEYRLRPRKRVDERGKIFMLTYHWLQLYTYTTIEP